MEIMATQTGNVTLPSRLTQVFFSTRLPRKWWQGKKTMLLGIKSASTICYPAR